MSLNIFSFQCEREFIKARYTELRNAKPSFDLKHFLAESGVKSTANLKEILEGKSKLERGSIFQIAKSLELLPIEANYFYAMIRYSQTGDQKYSQRMEALEKVFHHSQSDDGEFLLYMESI